MSVQNNRRCIENGSLEQIRPPSEDNDVEVPGAKPICSLTFILVPPTLGFALRWNVESIRDRLCVGYQRKNAFRSIGEQFLENGIADLAISKYADTFRCATNKTFAALHLRCQSDRLLRHSARNARDAIHIVLGRLVL